MAPRGTAQGGGFDHPFRTGGHPDRWDERPAPNTIAWHTGDGLEEPLREDDRRVPAPTQRDLVSSPTPSYLGITDGIHYRRPSYRTTGAVAAIGAVGGIVVIAAAWFAARTGDDTHVSPATTTGSRSAPSALPPRSAGTPQTPELPPAPPLTAEQMTPPPVVSPRWPRYEAPTQAKPPPPRVTSPPSMSFAPKPVTPPHTATPGNNGHHGFF